MHAKRERCLYTACIRGEYEIVEFLLEKGADIFSTEEPRRDNILRIVFDSVDRNDIDRYVEIVKLLIKHGANKDSALRWACETGDTFATKTLLVNGASINSGGFIPEIMKILNEYSWGIYEKN